MGDQSKSFPGSGDMPESRDEILDQRIAQLPRKDDPHTHPDKRPVAGLERLTQVA